VDAGAPRRVQVGRIRHSRRWRQGFWLAGSRAEAHITAAV